MNSSKYLVLSSKFIFVLLLLLVLNTCYILPNTAFAAETSLSLKPASLQIRANSPANITAPFRIVNTGTEAITLRIFFKRFRDAGDQTGKIVYSDPLTSQTDKDTFLQHVHIVADNLAIDTLTLGPQQTKDLLLAVTVDKNASSQDQYFSVIFVTHSPGKLSSDESDSSQAQGSFSTIDTGLALPVLLSINGSTESVGFLDKFSAPLTVQNGPIPFRVLVNNTGDHFIQAQGVILIKNMFGQVVGRVNLPKTNILASSERLVSSETSGTDTTAVWPEKFLLGFYTATLTLSISPEQSLYTRSIHFVAFPLAVSLTLLVVVFLAIFLFRRVKKKVSEQ